MEDASDAIRRRFEMVRPHLTESQRRVWLGAEASGWGPGGVTAVAAATGVAPTTVRRGQVEIAALPEPGAEPSRRSRRPGAGRKTAEAHDDALVAALESLMDPPDHGAATALRWTTSSVRALTRELRSDGHQISEFVVRRLLHQRGYQLHGASSAPQGVRGVQFLYLNGMVLTHLSAGDPVIMVRPSREQHADAAPSQPSPRAAARVGAPGSGTFGYDLAGAGPAGGWSPAPPNRGTAQFALDAVLSWWERMGRGEYPRTTRLMICHNVDGPDGFRSAWLAGLASLAGSTGLAVTCCYLPAGTWRWEGVGPGVGSHLEIPRDDGPQDRHHVIIREIRRPGAADAGQGPAAAPAPRSSHSARTAGALFRHELHGEWNVTAETVKHPNGTP